MTALAHQTTTPGQFMAFASSHLTPGICEDALKAAAAVEPKPQRHKLIAFEALAVLFPNYGNTRLGLRLGFTNPGQASAMVASAKDAFWWTDTQVDDVIGALVADQYGERAA
jgi:hypothetical protein